MALPGPEFDDIYIEPPFHDSIGPLLESVTPRMKNVATVVTTLCRVIIATHIDQFESRTQKQFNEMLERLGGKDSRHFNRNHRYWIDHAERKLRYDVERETRRHARMSTHSSSRFGGRFSKAL